MSIGFLLRPLHSLPVSKETSVEMTKRYSGNKTGSELLLQPLDLISQFRRLFEVQVFHFDLHLLFESMDESWDFVFRYFLQVGFFFFLRFFLCLFLSIDDALHRLDDALRGDAVVFVVLLLNGPAS